MADNPYFIYDGVDSRTLKIQMQREIVLDGAKPNIEKITIPGRNGTLDYWDGTYENREAVARCFILDNDASGYFAQAQKWMQSPVYKRLELSNEPDVYMMATVADSGDREILQGVLAPFKIKFDCKPQKYLKTGENAFEITNGDTLHNSWFEAKPLIRIYITGGGGTSGALKVGSATVLRSDVSSNIRMDCETQNAYSIGLGGAIANANNKIQTLKFPTLPPGDTEISWVGDISISKMQIVPRWWRL